MNPSPQGAAPYTEKRERHTMPKYLFRASYFPDAASSAPERQRARRTPCKNAAMTLGGRIESFHGAFGDDDLYFIADMPDGSAAAAFTAAMSRNTKTIRMVAIDEENPPPTRYLDLRRMVTACETADRRN